MTHSLRPVVDLQLLVQSNTDAPISIRGRAQVTQALQNFISSEKAGGRNLNQIVLSRIQGELEQTVLRQEARRRRR